MCQQFLRDGVVSKTATRRVHRCHITAPFTARVLASDAAQLFTDPDHPAFPAADLARCTDVNRFDFAMLAERRDGLLVMQPV